MKNIWIITSFLLLAACGEKTPEQFTVSGSVTGNLQDKVYLQDRVNGLWVSVDSAAIENGSFTFTGSVEYPMMRYLNIPGIDSRIMLFLENSDIAIEVDIQNPDNHLIQGSASHDIYQEFNKLVDIHEIQINEIQQKIIEAEVLAQQDQVDQLKQQYEQASENKKTAIRDFVAMHSDKTVGVFIAMRNLANDMEGQELAELVDSFDDSIKNTSYVTTLNERAEKLMALAIGKVAPDFTLTDINGGQISLSDFRGQYVLVSFWASWCPYCRQENPHLKELYSEYRNDNFEILGVSLDRNHQAWLKGIEEDGLEWPQISDLNGWQNAASSSYAVSSIPANVLVNPNGLIIGRNLAGEELDDTLEQVLRQPA